MKHMNVNNAILSIMLLLFAPSMTQTMKAQEYKQSDLDWYNLSPTADKVYGVGANEAYQLLKGRKARRVVVALIGSGLDVSHEDLKGKVWKNQREKLFVVVVVGIGLVVYFVFFIFLFSNQNMLFISIN